MTPTGAANNMRRLITAIGVAALLVGACARSTPGPANANTGGPRPAATMALDNTSWTLTHLGTEPVVVADKQREPFLTFKDGQVTGNAGCNRLAGGYTQNGSTVTFTQVALTRMACDSGMDVEATFTVALGKAARVRSVGADLELIDVSGAAVARFTARPIP